jgi:hypothetical protein
LNGQQLKEKMKKVEKNTKLIDFERLKSMKILSEFTQDFFSKKYT